MSNPFRPLRLVAIVLLTALAPACSSGVAEPVSAEGVGASAAAVEPAVPADTRDPLPAAPACPGPIRLGILIDKSGSTRENVVAQMSPAEFEIAVALIETCGGDFAIGMLCNISGEKPFIRLHLNAPPPMSPERTAAPSADPFTRLRQTQVASAVAVRHAAERERGAEARRAEIDPFHTEALKLIQAPVSCTRTDVIAGVNRVLTFLAEPVPVGVTAPIRVGMYITDGQDNVRRQTLHHDPDLDAVHMVVGGSGDVGALAPLDPARFENAGAALRWLRAAAETR